MVIEIVSFPTKNGGSFHSYVKLPEGNDLEHLKPLSQDIPHSHAISCFVVNIILWEMSMSPWELSESRSRNAAVYGGSYKTRIPRTVPSGNLLDSY